VLRGGDEQEPKKLRAPKKCDEIAAYHLVPPTAGKTTDYQQPDRGGLESITGMLGDQLRVPPEVVTVIHGDVQRCAPEVPEEKRARNATTAAAAWAL